MTKIYDVFSHGVKYDGTTPDESWANHLARTNGLRGGVDLAYSKPEVIPSPARGVIKDMGLNGGAGLVLKLQLADGRFVVFEHLSKILVKHGSKVTLKEPIARSGNTGGVPYHLHVHLEEPDGTRRNLFHHLRELPVELPSPSKP